MYKVPPLPAEELSDFSDMMKFFHQELEKVGQAFENVQNGEFLPELHVAPAKPRNGKVAYADGTNWNPGSGKGIYFYNGTAWVPLHT